MSQDLDSSVGTINYDQKDSEKICELQNKVGNSEGISNLSDDLDSSVETIYYEEESSEKIRELEDKVTSMEKYIKELETIVHIQRAKNGVLRDKVKIYTGVLF